MKYPMVTKRMPTTMNEMMRSTVSLFARSIRNSLATTAAMSAMAVIQMFLFAIFLARRKSANPMSVQKIENVVCTMSDCVKSTILNGILQMTCSVLRSIVFTRINVVMLKATIALVFGIIFLIVDLFCFQ